jgi:hypothetical protein
MLTNGFADIIKAVGHEPLGFFSLVFLILGSICYRVVKNLGKPKPREIAVILAIILLGFSGLALAFIRADNRISAQKEDQTKTPDFSAVVKLTGERRSLQPAQVSFRNSAGQVNFGCEESKTSSVSWTLPAGAEQINATAAWINTDNVKGQDQHAVVTGLTATATGVITGRDRDWTHNCPGGGHGELVVQGTYQIMQPSAPTPFEAVQSGSVSKGKPLSIPLPIEQGLQITSCEATIVADGTAPIVLRVVTVPAAGSAETHEDQKGPFRLIVGGKKAVVSLSQ